LIPPVIFVTSMISKAILLSGRVIGFSHRREAVRSEFKVPLTRPRNMEVKSDLRFSGIGKRDVKTD
jgi:ABC-type nitrate/sulfonate/bicarbonate transport system ATPase subunit